MINLMEFRRRIREFDITLNQYSHHQLTVGETTIHASNNPTFKFNDLYGTEYEVSTGAKLEANIVLYLKTIEVVLGEAPETDVNIIQSVIYSATSSFLKISHFNLEFFPFPIASADNRNVFASFFPKIFLRIIPA